MAMLICSSMKTSLRYLPKSLLDVGGTLRSFNIVIENGPCIDDLPMKIADFYGDFPYVKLPECLSILVG